MVVRLRFRGRSCKRFRSDTRLRISSRSRRECHRDKAEGKNSVFYECPDCGNKYLGRDFNLKDYPNDIAAAYEMEVEIERRGLQRWYGLKLFDLINTPQNTADNNFSWLLAHATPAQRCRAALLAAQEE